MVFGRNKNSETHNKHVRDPLKSNAIPFLPMQKAEEDRTKEEAAKAGEDGDVSSPGGGDDAEEVAGGGDAKAEAEAEGGEAKR